MRVLFVSHSMPEQGQFLENLGGMQRLTKELTTTMEAHPDVDLTPVVLRSSANKTALNLIPFMTRVLFRLPRLVSKHGIDVVLFSSPVTAALAPLLRGRLNAKVAMLAHGLDVTLRNSAYQWYLPKIFASVDAIFAISRATARECRRRGASEAQVEVVPLGVDLGRFQTARPVETGAVEKRPFLLCSVGRQVERKGFEWFIREVMPLLPPSVHYALAGTGPESDAIGKAVAELELTDRVHLLGRVSEEGLHDLFQKADLFVMPNIPVPGDMEGFGLVLLEAGVNGLPSLAADLEGIRDVISEGKNGHLIEPQQAAAFAAAVMRYAEDPEALKERSRETARHVATVFAWPVVIETYIDLLASLVSNK